MQLGPFKITRRGADDHKVNARALWGAILVSLVSGLWLLSVLDLPTLGSVATLFWFTMVVTLSCAVSALGVMLVAGRVGQPELAILGAGLFASSLFPFVHGLTLEGMVWQSETNATTFGAWGGLPAALIVALPVLSDRVPWRTFSLRHASAYSLTAIVIVTAACAVMLATPNSVPAARPDVWWAVAGAMTAFVGAQVLAYRQVRLYEVGRRLPSFAAALGFTLLGVSALFWLVPDPNGTVVWAAHSLDGFGVLAAAAGLMLSHRHNRSLTTVFAPIFNRDPTVALRLGVTPQIERFIAMLDQKDRTTAGHVTRVAELTMRLGERAGLKGERLRNLGLGALLHDIGKLDVPTEILTKPDRLTEAEFEIVKRHSVRGQEILAADPELERVGLLVRHHHERVDGRGYPDGLSGGEIPLEASLIAVADAWDAMVQTRHYRVGMNSEDARSILRAHAGTQWSAETVDILLEQLDAVDGLDDLFADLAGDDQHVCTDALYSVTSI